MGHPVPVPKIWDIGHETVNGTFPVLSHVRIQVLGSTATALRDRDACLSGVPVRCQENIGLRTQGCFRPYSNRAALTDDYAMRNYAQDIEPRPAARGDFETNIGCPKVPSHIGQLGHHRHRARKATTMLGSCRPRRGICGALACDHGVARTKATFHLSGGPQAAGEGPIERATPRAPGVSGDPRASRPACGAATRSGAARPRPCAGR